MKLGFTAGSDHRSTHMSFAAVYSKGIDRQSIFDVLRARRTYTATGKILLDFSIGKGVMGEEIEISYRTRIRRGPVLSGSKRSSG
jgi:hypothetical protein